MPGILRMNHPDHDGRPNVSALRRAAPWIAGGFLALMVLIVLGAVGSIAWHGFGMFNDQAKAAIHNNPGVIEAVGEIREIRMDFTATGNTSGAETFAYRIEGERANGLLVGRFVTVSGDAEELRDGRLTLDDGRVIPLPVSATPRSP